MRHILTPLLLASLCALPSQGCSKPAPEPPPKVEETCATLASQYLKCVKGTQDPNADALKALEASIVAKCEQLRPSAPKLAACANAPCDKIEACLKDATPAPTPPPTPPTP